MRDLHRRAQELGVVLPTYGTLAKYGWELHEWLAMLDSQGWVCPICERMPSTGKFVTDHFHEPGWAAMPPQERKKYIRGLTCWSDNRYLLGRGITSERAENVLRYLRDFEERRP